jgi:ABC-type multidrug transport system permease subunit
MLIGFLGTRYYCGIASIQIQFWSALLMAHVVLCIVGLAYFLGLLPSPVASEPLYSVIDCHQITLCT